MQPNRNACWAGRSGAALLAAAFLVLPGCGDDGAAETGRALGELQQEVRQARLQNERLVERLDRLERRLDGHAQDIDRLGREKIAAMQRLAAEAEEAGRAAPEAADPGSPFVAAPQQLESLLSSESGRAAVQSALRAIEEEREQERRERWLSSMVDRFAAEAQLTPQQADDVSRILDTSFRKIGAVWSTMRDAGDLSPEARETMRQENLAKMEEIRAITNDEMKAVLSLDQYALYEQQAQRMRGFGDRGDRGDRGRRGGPR